MIFRGKVLMEENTSLNDLLNSKFGGKVVRKDLTKMVKEGTNGICWRG
jgi:predicted ATP-dependent Lon-type protease